MRAVGVEVHAGERARRRAAARRPRARRSEARAVAREHPEVRQQVVAEVDGLGALQVRVAGHRPVERAPRRAPAARPSARRSRARRARSARARTSRGRSPPGRCASAPCAAGRRPARRSPSGAARSPCGCLRRRARTRSVPSRELALDRVEAGEQRVAIGLGDDPARGEHARVRARLRDVLRPQPPIEVERACSGAGSRGAGARGSATRRQSTAARRPGPSTSRASASRRRRATWPSPISGKNGSASERAATSSQTGNSPSRWPKRSR